MEKLKIFIADKHYYDYIKIMNKNSFTHQLFYSNDSEWNVDVQGQKICEIIDDGTYYKNKIPKLLHASDLLHYKVLFSLACKTTIEIKNENTNIS